MNVKSRGIELSISTEEASALVQLLGNMSLVNMEMYVDEDEAQILENMYDVLSEVIPFRETE